MGKPVIRLGQDLSTGHNGNFPVVAVGASGNVFVNGMGVVRDGDPYQPHWRREDRRPHTGYATSGSTVFVNGKPAQRAGDSNTCGDTADNGSKNVGFG